MNIFSFYRFLISVILSITTINCFPGLSESPLLYLYPLLRSKTFSIGGDVIALKSIVIVRKEVTEPGSATIKSEEIKIDSSISRFKFSQTHSNGSEYAITIQNQPFSPSQNCEIGSAKGRFASEDISSVVISCNDRNDVETPAFSIPGGEYHNALSISITSATSSTTLYYSLDGSNPNCSGTNLLYTTPIFIAQPTMPSITLKAIACKGEFSSAVQSTNYLITNGLLAQPTYNLPGGIYFSTQTVTISPPGTPAAATIHYTLDNSTPNCSSQSVPNSIDILFSQTVKSVTCHPTHTTSSVYSVDYTINGTVSTPVFGILGSSFSNDIQLSLSVPTVASSIRYSIATGVDPALPNCTTSLLYTTQIPIATNDTRIQTIGCRTGWTDSLPSTIQSYLFQVSPAVLTPVPFTYSTDQNVSASNATIGSTIHYSGTGIPNCGSSSTAIDLIAGTETTTLISVIGCKSGYQNSILTQGNYTITGTLASPTMSLASGDYPLAQSVTINPPAIPAAGVLVHYTLDGSLPNCSSPTTPNPVLISASTPLRAIACKSAPDWLPSTDTTENYTINGQVVLPMFSANPGLQLGNYINDQLISISTITPGSTIRYTLGDGTQAPPTCLTGSLGNSVLIDNNVNRVVKAIACKLAFTDSNIATSNTYNLIVSQPVPDIAPGTYTTSQSITLTTTTTAATIRWDYGVVPSCVSGNTGPINLNANTGTHDIRSIGCKTGYSNSTTMVGNYILNGMVGTPTVNGPNGVLNIINVTSNAPPATGLQSRCYKIGSDPECSITLGGVANQNGGYCAINTIPYTIPLQISTSSDVRIRSCSDGWLQSAIESRIVTIVGTTGLVAFSPDPATVANNDYTTTLSSVGSTSIFYRTDGTNPNCTGVGSTLYSGVIPIVANGFEIRAIGCAPLQSPSGIITKIAMMQPAALTSTGSAAGTYNNNLTFNNTQITTGAVTYYRTDGTPPDCLNTGAVGTTIMPGGGVGFPNATGPSPQVRAVSCKTNYLTSPTLSINYDFIVGSPELKSQRGSNIPNTTAMNKSTLRPTSTSTNSWICGRSDGGNPTCAGSNACTAPSTLIQNTASGLSTNFISNLSNFKLIACKINYQSSAIESWNINLDLNKLRIYTTTSASYQGNVSLVNLDNACSTEINRPFTGVDGNVLKGLRIGAGRTLLNDWPMRASQNYYREDGITLIGTTRPSNDGFNLPISNSILTTPTNLWTGIDITGGVFSASTAHCVNWTSNGGPPGTVGQSQATNLSDLFANTSTTCNNSNDFYCIETINSKRIFVTNSTFRIAGGCGANINGKACADGKCGADVNYPGSGTFKALIGSGGSRRACGNSRFPDCFNPVDSLDWVLTPNTNYVRSDGGLSIGTTTANGVFAFPLTNTFTSAGGRAWTGIEDDWETDGSTDDCGGWNSMGDDGRYGNLSQTAKESISDGNEDCTNFNRLICVEQ